MISYDEALALLKEYNQGEFHLKHAYIVSDVMGWFAEQLGYGGGEGILVHRGPAPRSGL